MGRDQCSLLISLVGYIYNSCSCFRKFVAAQMLTSGTYFQISDLGSCPKFSKSLMEQSLARFT